MKVLVIPEDCTHDGFIIQPIVEALLSDAGIQARVDVLWEPHLRGASEALNPKLLASIIDANRMVDVFVLVVDRDCDRERNAAKAEARENEHPGKLIACVAVEELEVWMLALHRDKFEETWSVVRAECDPKERFAQPLLNRLGSKGPGAGRKQAMRALKGKLGSLRSLCSEVDELAKRLASFKTSAG